MQSESNVALRVADKCGEIFLADLERLRGLVRRSS